MSQPVDPYQQGPQSTPADPYQASSPGFEHLSPAPYLGYSPQSARPGSPPYPPAPATNPYPSMASSPAAPYGYDPMSAQPYSDKSKVVAGLLQILPGFVFGLGGIGRLYAGNVQLGVAQIVATVIGWVSFWCGLVLILPFFIFAGVWLWFVIDGILILAGRPTDGQGRPLRA
jgi:TM2 domain-containing membrane protein YozV